MKRYLFMTAGALIAMPGVMLLASTGCQRPAVESTYEVWNGEGELPEVFLSPQYKSVQKTKVFDESVQFSEQRIGVAKVENGALQIIRDEAGNKVYAKAFYKVSPTGRIPFSEKQIQKFSNRKENFLRTLEKSPWLKKTGSILSPVDVDIITLKTKAHLSYAVDILISEDHEVNRFWFSPDQEILKQEKVSSDFDVSAWILTLENMNEPQEVNFSAILDLKKLRSSTHEVISQAGTNLSDFKAPYKFTLEDPLFDQIQSFYFVSKAIDFYKANLSWSSFPSIEVETSYGYPEKINAAFTYQNKIRLGTGDNKSYQRLAQDPSVVIHEVNHVMIDAISHLPNQGEGGSLNEAFADFFAASFLNSPKMGSYSVIGSPYRRNLEDFIPYSEKTGGLYHDSQIVSGTLWELRKVLGVAESHRLALKTLARLGPAQSLSEFTEAITLAGEELPSEQQKSLQTILRKWQWVP